MRDNYLQPTLLFAPQNLDADGFTANYPNKVFIGINELEIPSNVNIVTLEQYGDNEGKKNIWTKIIKHPPHFK